MTFAVLAHHMLGYWLCPCDEALPMHRRPLSSPEHLQAVQAEALAHTTVLVTPCGSLAALAYLLPPGATAVVMNFYQSATGANVQLDDAAFWNVDHVTLTYYPVGPEDYEGTSVSRSAAFVAHTVYLRVGPGFRGRRVKIQEARIVDTHSLAT